MKDDVDIPQGEGIEAHRYTTGVACKSWHGSLNSSDSYVPLIVSYPGGNANIIKAIIDSPNVCLGLQCEGNWKVPDIIKAITKQQYQPN
jgi:hypothetical protein